MQFDTLSDYQLIFMLLFVVYRFRNNIFHGNKGVESWLQYKEQIDFCRRVMQSLISLTMGKGTVYEVKWKISNLNIFSKSARSEPFNCDKHLFEVKWDGTRCLGFIEDDRLQLQNRHLIDIGDRYPELACLRGLPVGTVIDGEIVVLRDGRPSFQKLQQRDHLQDPGSGSGPGLALPSN